MKKLAVLFALLLTSCGGIQFLPPPTVHASGFSDASLIGAYAVQPVPGAPMEVLTFDGLGAVTVQTRNLNNECDVLTSGSYHINVDGTGTAIFAIPGPIGCQGSQESMIFVLAANSQTFFFQTGQVAGWGIKQ